MTTTEHHTAETATDHLTTGWEPDLDHEDTLVRHYVFAHAAANLAPARAMGGRILERNDVIAADLGVPNAVFNAAVLTRPPGEGGWDSHGLRLALHDRHGARQAQWSVELSDRIAERIIRVRLLSGHVDGRRARRR